MKQINVSKSCLVAYVMNKTVNIIFVFSFLETYIFSDPGFVTIYIYIYIYIKYIRTHTHTHTRIQIERSVLPKLLF